MSRKYIKELLSYNFVYPNNTVPEYDLEIVHDINDNSVSGTVATFTGLLTSSTGITISMTGTWSLNGAEPYINQSDNINIFSVHMMDLTQNYYRPWSLVYNKSVATGTTTYSYNETFSVTPSMVGVTGFTAGTYYFEVRMIGHRAVYPICVTIPISSAPTPTPTNTPSGTPTPTPTSTPGGVTPTPTPTSTPGGITPTPSSTPTGTPTPTPSSTVDGGKSLMIYAKDVDGTRATLTMFYKVNSGANINIPGATGTQIPADCTYLYTITGLALGDVITIGTSINCVMTGADGIGMTCPSSISSNITFVYVMDAPTVQQNSITIDSGNIPTPVTPTPTPTLAPVGIGIYTGATFGSSSAACADTNYPSGTVYLPAGDTLSNGDILYVDPTLFTQFTGNDNYYRLYSAPNFYAATISSLGYVSNLTNCSVTPTPTATLTPTPTPSATSSGSPVRVDWFLKAAAKASVQVLSNTSSLLLDETSAGVDRSGTIYVALSDLPYTVVGNWASGSGNIVRYNICDTGNGGEVYASGPIDVSLGSESYLVTPTPLWITINVVGNNTTPPTCP
jgi:hypothetical protein